MITLWQRSAKAIGLPMENISEELNGYLDQMARIDTVFQINHGADSAESAPAALFRK